MKKLHIYMLKSFSGPFVATFFISMFVLIMQFLWMRIDDLVGKGLDWDIIFQLLYYVALTLVPMGLPLAVLLASIMTFGNLGENYELTALKAAGISLFRIMAPLIVVICFVTVGAFFFSNDVLPYANLKAMTLMHDIQRAKPELSLKEGVFINDIDKYSIKVDKIDKNTGMMYGMTIYNHTEIDKNYEVTKADSGLMVTSPNGLMMKVTLFDGMTMTDEQMKNRNATSFPFRKVFFEKQTFSIPLSGNDLQRSDEERYKDDYRMLNIKQLETASDSLQDTLSKKKSHNAQRLIQEQYIKHKIIDKQRDSIVKEKIQGETLSLDSLFLSLDAEELKDVMTRAASNAKEVSSRTRNEFMVTKRDEDIIRKHDIEWHRKFALSFACFIFFFIGAPLGGIIRKGGLGMPVVISIFLFIMYYIISMIGERSAREGVMLPIVGMWLSSVVLLPLGAMLTYQAMTDSAVLNAEVYMTHLKKFFGFFKKKKKNAQA